MMKYARFAMLSLLGLALVVVLGCSAGNHSSDSEAEVYLTVDVRSGPADVDIAIDADVTVGSMSINSRPKVDGQQLTGQSDVLLTEWVVTAVRTDGGTAASPQWHNFYNVYIPGGGSAQLQNYRIFPYDFFHQAPLNQLYPENGGMDKETGKPNIRQRLQVEAYGKTVAGKRVVCSFPVNLNFFYQ
jgi:hypothetical protein